MAELLLNNLFRRSSQTSIKALYLSEHRILDGNPRNFRCQLYLDFIGARKQGRKSEALPAEWTNLYVSLVIINNFVSVWGRVLPMILLQKCIAFLVLSRSPLRRNGLVQSFRIMRARARRTAISLIEPRFLHSERDTLGRGAEILRSARKASVLHNKVINTESLCTLKISGYLLSAASADKIA